MRSSGPPPSYVQTPTSQSIRENLFDEKRKLTLKICDKVLVALSASVATNAGTRSPRARRCHFSIPAIHSPSLNALHNISSRSIFSRIRFCSPSSSYHHRRVYEHICELPTRLLPSPAELLWRSSHSATQNWHANGNYLTSNNQTYNHGANRKGEVYSRRYAPISSAKDERSRVDFRRQLRIHLEI